MWVRLLTPHGARGRMFPLCPTESAFSHHPPASCVAPYRHLCTTNPCPLPTPSQLFPRFSFYQWHYHGKLKPWLFKEARSSSNSLITWHTLLTSWLCRYSHRCLHGFGEICIMQSVSFFRSQEGCLNYSYFNIKKCWVFSVLSNIIQLMHAAFGAFHNLQCGERKKNVTH